MEKFDLTERDFENFSGFISLIEKVNELKIRIIDYIYIRKVNF